MPGLAGVLKRDASFTNLGVRGGLEASPSLQRYGMMHHSGKREKRKTGKKKKKKNDSIFSLSERTVKVLPEKIMPTGLHFRGANGAAA